MAWKAPIARRVIGMARRSRRGLAWLWIEERPQRALVGRQGGRQVAEVAVELAGQYHAALGRGVGADLDDLLGVDRRVLIPTMKRSVCHPASDSTTGEENPQGLAARSLRPARPSKSIGESHSFE
ncbi:hypothetical protein ABZ352_29530 [Streptomyces griseofuscus]|uniref:hypothetical protein n=1 Tax=Streptomyces griseofuscus TaxID=146922 RepID=UPI0033EF0109